MSSKLGLVLSEYMTKKDISAKQLAKDANVSPGFVSLVLSGKRSPNIQTAEKMANALGLVPEERDRLLRTIMEPSSAIAIHTSRPDKRISEWIANAQTSVRIMSTWSSTPMRFRKSFEEALKLPGNESRLKIQILMMDPDSAFATARGHDIWMTKPCVGERKTAQDNFVQRSIYTSLIDYKVLIDLGINIEVRLFDRLPSLICHIVDDKAVFSFYLHGQMAESSPHIQIDMPSPTSPSVLGEMLEQEFQTLWEDSEPASWPKIKEGFSILIQ